MNMKYLCLFLVNTIFMQHVEASAKLCVQNDPCDTEHPLVRQKRRSPKCADGEEGEKSSRDTKLNRIHYDLDIQFKDFMYQWTFTNAISDVSGVNITMLFQNFSVGALYPMEGCCNIPLKEKKCIPQSCKQMRVYNLIQTKSASFFKQTKRKTCNTGENKPRTTLGCFFMEINGTFYKFNTSTAQLVKDDNVADPTNPSNPMKHLRDFFNNAYVFQMHKDDLVLSDHRIKPVESVSTYMNRDVYAVEYLEWNETGILNRKKNTTYSYKRGANMTSTRLDDLTFHGTGKENLTCMFIYENNNNNPINTPPWCMPPSGNASSTAKEDKDDKTNLDLVFIISVPVAVCFGLALICLICYFSRRLMKLYKIDKESVENAADALMKNFTYQGLTEDVEKTNKEKIDLFDEAEKKKLGLRVVCDVAATRTATQPNTTYAQRHSAAIAEMGVGQYTRLLSQTSSAGEADGSNADSSDDSANIPKQGSTDDTDVSQGIEFKPHRWLAKAMQPSQSLQMIPSYLKNNEEDLTKKASCSTGNLYIPAFPKPTQQPVQSGIYQKVQAFC